MNDFKAEPIELQNAVIEAANRVLRSGWFVLGKEVESFEMIWAQTLQCERAVGVGNGMDAIEIALRALNIGEGDEVITTPMTAFATVLAILRAGAVPVLGDIDPESGLLSMESAQRCISNKTKAVLLVHLYGQIRNMQAWQEFCQAHRLDLIEDCAQSHLANLDGQFAGTFGKAGAYSFYPTKNLGAPGDAGMLVTQDVELANKAMRLRNYGQNIRYHHPDIGMNSRLDEIQAAILSERIKWLPGFTLRRKEIANTYYKQITNPKISLLAPPQTAESHVFHLYVVTCSNRDGLQAHLNSCGVQSLIHYPVPMHFQEPCKNIKRDLRGLGISEEHAARCLSLPCHPQMTDNDLQIVVDSINSF